MHHYICYLKGKKENKEITSLLSSVFECANKLIGDLFSYEDFEIRFENRLLDEFSEFNTELNVYMDKPVNKLFADNFLFGLEVSNVLNEEILVSIKNDNPYEWILIRDRLFFTVEETGGDYNGITLDRLTTIRISQNEAEAASDWQKKIFKQNSRY
jgi:hypothetical protein